MKSWLSLLCGVLASASTVTVHADLIVTFSQTSIEPNAEGSVDVFVTGVNSATDVSGFGLKIGIEPVDALNSVLQFLPDGQQSTDYAIDASLNPPYIFLNDPYSFPTIFVSPDFPGSPLLNRADVSDGIFGTTTVEVGQTFLLATLNLQLVTEAVPPSLAAGDTFRIYVLEDDSGFSGSGFPPAEIEWTDLPGTVRAVPEPTTFGIVLFGVAAIVGSALWRRKREAAEDFHQARNGSPQTERSDSLPVRE